MKFISDVCKVYVAIELCQDDLPYNIILCVYSFIMRLSHKIMFCYSYAAMHGIATLAPYHWNFIPENFDPARETKF